MRRAGRGAMCQTKMARETARETAREMVTHGLTHEPRAPCVRALVTCHGRGRVSVMHEVIHRSLWITGT